MAFRASLDSRSKSLLQHMKKADVARDLRRELMASTAGAVPAVRLAARSLPSTRKAKKSESLRSAVAMSIKRKVKVSTRAITVVIYSAPHGGKSNLARVVEGAVPWKHPTYGHSPDVTQEPMPFFTNTMEKLTPPVEARIHRIFTNFGKKF